jgi:serine protease inhibitor
MNKFLTFALGLGLLVLGSCEDNNNLTEDKNEEMKPITLNAKSQMLVDSDNNFGLELFRRINAEEAENFNISPLSVSLALAMTLNGAKGETRSAMEEAMKLKGLTADEINTNYKTLVDALLDADKKVTLGIAQSIWYRNNFNVLDSFKTTNQTYYNAEVNALDFSRSDALGIINGWIEGKTNGKIKDMIQEISPAHVMFLINAIYFNGSWSTKFDVSKTSKKNFYAKDATLTVDMMHKTDSIAYMKNALFSAVELPYGRGNFNMVLLLPNDPATFDACVDSLTVEHWKLLMDGFKITPEVELYMPRFKAEYEINLNDLLSVMGMGITFTPQADFSGINGAGGIFIDYVQHNTFIDVDEKGTEAAAATVVAIRETAMPETTVFNANRPFIYAITEKQTGAILFIGKVAKP